MAPRKGECLSNGGNTNGCTGLRLADLDTHGAPVCVANVRKGVEIPKKISSPANEDQKVCANPRIDRALLEFDVVTCCPSEGVICVLGQKRYILTDRSYQGSRNLAQHVRDDFGAGARLAEYSDLLEVSTQELDKFARAIGLGSAFVSFEGCTECASGRQYFICSNSGVLTDQYIVPEYEDGIWEQDEDFDEDEDFDDDWIVDIPAHVARVELCCRAGRRLPVLVEVSASHDNSVYRVASVSSCNMTVSL